LWEASIGGLSIVGILAMDESYHTLFVTTPDLGQYISGVILFEETLYQSTLDGRKIVDVLLQQKNSCRN